MIKFEKVSYDNYIESCDNLFGLNSSFKRFEAEKSYENIIIPRRGTAHSAGYDFFWQFKDTVLKSGESIVVPTGIKAQMDSNVFLSIFPRSGLGFKYKLGLYNTVGIIDADYYDNELNEGHIFIKIVNNGNKDLTLQRDKGYAQGIFMKYLTTSDDSTSGERKGGIGSTDKNQ